MAIFGDLEHHTLTDLFKVLSAQAGTLFFHQAYQGRTVEMVLEGACLCALYVDGFPVPDAAQARATAQHLHAQGRGAFEFQPRSSTPGAGARQGARFYALPLTELLHDTLSRDIPADQLPHPETRFVAQSLSAEVPAPLAAAWRMLAPHLRSGASAAELARLTGQAEADLQATLYRLRAADLVAPLRTVPLVTAAPAAQPGLSQAGQVQPEQIQSSDIAPLPASAPVAPAPLLRRLLGALRRLAGSGAA